MIGLLWTVNATNSLVCLFFFEGGGTRNLLVYFALFILINDCFKKEIYSIFTSPINFFCEAAHQLILFWLVFGTMSQSCSGFRKK